MNRNKNNKPQKNNISSSIDPEIRTKGTLTYKRKYVSNVQPSKILAEETIEIKKTFIQPTSCTNPEYAKDLSFSSRYAYDSFNFLQFIKKPAEQPPPVNQNPQFTPWRQRYENGIPDPEIPSGEDKIMEDREPHYLLLDQSGYLGNGPPPYPRQRDVDFYLF